MVHGRIGRRGAVAVAVVEEESPQERAPVPRRSLGANLAQERAWKAKTVRLGNAQVGSTC